MNDNVNLKKVLDDMNYARQRRKNGDEHFSNLGEVQKGIINAFVFSAQNGKLSQEEADLFVTNLVTDSSILGVSNKKGKENDCYGTLDYLSKAYQINQNSLESEMSGKTR